MNDSPFNWNGLTSQNLAPLEDFYAQLFGWEIKDVPMGEGVSFRLIHAGDEMIGHVMEPEEGDPAPHAYWMSYITVDNLDQTAARVKELGGQEIVPPSEVTNTGRFACIADPQGAVISLFQGNGDGEGAPQPENPSPIGKMCWNECLTTNAAAGSDFYASLLGWQVESNEVEVGDKQEIYRIFKKGEAQIAGCMDLPKEALESGARPFWLSYVGVECIDVATQKARDLGATIVIPPTEIKDIGSFSVFLDPQGAQLGLFELKH